MSVIQEIKKSWGTSPAKKPSAGPRKADTYRANRKSLPKAQRVSLPVIERRWPKRTKAWPNPENPIQGRQECARRLRQLHITGGAIRNV